MRVHPRHGRAGFTLIELLVVIGVVGILAALLLPAVQSAREAGRRAACQNNLKQLSLGLLQYHDAHHCFPMGTPYWRNLDGGRLPGHSWLVAVTPWIEAKAIFDAANFEAGIYRHANQTVHSFALGSMHCPSDGSVRDAFVYEQDYLDFPPGQFEARFSSYAACAGTWYHMPATPEELTSTPILDKGIAYVNSRVRIADIRDGTHSTFLLAERAHGRLDESWINSWHWWFDGYQADTLFWTLYPINCGPRQATAPRVPPADASSAGSFHPGGANFAFADGSVRFLKDTIASWAIDDASGLPAGLEGNTASGFRAGPGLRFELYQALSTRNGREVVE